MDFFSTESYRFTFIQGIRGAVNTGSVISLQISLVCKFGSTKSCERNDGCLVQVLCNVSLCLNPVGALKGHHSSLCVACLVAGGNPKGKFALGLVQNEWKVYVKRPLDREEQDIYYLNITATDGLFVTQAAVEVTVTDVNDNNPVCEQVS